MNKIRARIAPSPTGALHIGTARTALFNYLFAKKNKGEFLLRFEDTDQNRSTKKHEKEIIKSLKWLGLDWDGETAYQMKRLSIYKKYADKLLKEDKVYECFCTPDELEAERKTQLAAKKPPRYSGKCRDLKEDEKKELKKKGIEPTLRLKVPEDRGKIEFEDLIRGKIQEESALIGDFVIMKSNEVPLFFFAGVIDDVEQKISHVIRGEDHISNTFNQILIYEALGWGKKMPKFAHIPFVLNKDRSKLSKRRGDEVTVRRFRELGYLPEAMINFLALLGWHPRTKKEGKEEIYSKEELIDAFDLREVGKAAATFDSAKLDYINGYYIRKFDDKKLAELLIPDHLGADWEKQDKTLLAAVNLVKERMKKLSDFTDLADYFFEKPIYDKEVLIFRKSDKIYTERGLKAATEALGQLSEKDWEEQKLQKTLEKVVKDERLNNGDVFWPTRAALSGRMASPSPVELLFALGKQKSLKRLNTASKLLE